MYDNNYNKHCDLDGQDQNINIFEERNLFDHDFGDDNESGHDGCEGCEDCVYTNTIWATVETYTDLLKVNLDFVNGKIQKTPYHLGPMDNPSPELIANLNKLHKYGFLTVSGQESRYEYGVKYIIDKEGEEEDKSDENKYLHVDCRWQIVECRIKALIGLSFHIIHSTFYIVILSNPV